MDAKPHTKPALRLSRPTQLSQKQELSHPDNHQQQQPAPAASHASGCLQGVDLVEQVAQSTTLQRRRWTELYRRLWERKAKVDIADTILFLNGRPCDWYFTSAATGEVKKKSEAKVNASAIRRHCIKASAVGDGGSSETSRQRSLARLVHEDAGQLKISLLRESELSFTMSLPPSALTMAAVLLQPLLPLSRQPAQARGTFVAKYNVVATSSCTRVLHLETGGLYGLPSSQSTAAGANDEADKRPLLSETGARHLRRPNSAPASAQNHQLENVVKAELRKLVHEVELAFRDRVRLLTADFQITDSHRLVLVRVSGVVFFSDLTQKKKKAVKKQVRGAVYGVSGSGGFKRPTGTTEESSKCSGRAFCHCKELVSAAGLSRFGLPHNHSELRHITRKSILLSESESAFLERFGAEAEANLCPVKKTMMAAPASWTQRSDGNDGQNSAVTKLLDRRIFMLQNTLWNPKSDAFDAKALEFENAQWLPHQYEMVAVCPACYIIYHVIDAERFERRRATARAAAQKTTVLLRSNFLASERAAISTSHGTRGASNGLAHVRSAWDEKGGS